MLLKRHHHKYVKTNAMLEKQWNENSISIHRMKQKSVNPVLLIAMKHLNQDGMNLFKKVMRDSSDYVYDEYDDGTCFVYHSQYPSKKRRFPNKMTRCTCNDVVANRQ